jgi:hypothetical protein
MGPSPDDEPRDSVGPPDRQTLQLLERQLGSDSLVTETTFDPNSHEPRLLRAVLDENQYPESIATARLDIRWFTTGEFSVHYVEEPLDGTRWECRWDRHPNSHNTRLHFHRPPTAEEVTDLSLPSLHPLEVYSTVLAAVETRVEDLWSA